MATTIGCGFVTAEFRTTAAAENTVIDLESPGRPMRQLGKGYRRPRYLPCRQRQVTLTRTWNVIRQFSMDRPAPTCSITAQILARPASDLRRGLRRRAFSRIESDNYRHPAGDHENHLHY